MLYRSGVVNVVIHNQPTVAAFVEFVNIIASSLNVAIVKKDCVFMYRRCNP